MAKPLDQTHADAQTDTMSFGDHLDELRKRLFWAFAVPLPLAVIALPFTDTLIEVLVLPLFKALAASGLPQAVQALGPAEIVLTQLKLCVLVACVISAPWMLWQAWLFISPGLYQQERRFVNLLVPGSAVLTIAGVLLLYYLMLPVMLTVMVGIGANVQLHTADVYVEPRVAEAMTATADEPILVYATPPANPALGQKWIVNPDFSRTFIAVSKDGGGVEAVPLPASATVPITQQYRLSEYIDFVLLMTVGVVIGFQMPLVVMLLGWIGIASPEFFRKNRRYALFGCAAAAAIITPSSDMVSMLVMMLPLYALYELGILLLVLAPAHKVAQGRVFALPRLPRRFPWFRRKVSTPVETADKRPPSSETPASPAQTKPAATFDVRSGAGPDDPAGDAADGDGEVRS